MPCSSEYDTVRDDTFAYDTLWYDTLRCINVGSKADAMASLIYLPIRDIHG